MFGQDPEIKRETVFAGPSPRPSSALVRRTRTYAEVASDSGRGFDELTRALPSYRSVLAALSARPLPTWIDRRLLIAALRESETGFYASAEALLESRASLRGRLEALVRLTFAEDSQGEVKGQWGLWFDLWNEAFRHPEVARDRRGLDEQWRGLIMRMVQAGIDAGEVPDDIDVETFAVTWAALLDGLAVQVALDDPLVPGERAESIALAFAHRELRLS